MHETKTRMMWRLAKTVYGFRKERTGVDVPASWKQTNALSTRQYTIATLCTLCFFGVSYALHDGIMTFIYSIVLFCALLVFQAVVGAKLVLRAHQDLWTEIASFLATAQPGEGLSVRTGPDVWCRMQCLDLEWREGLVISVLGAGYSKNVIVGALRSHPRYKNCLDIYEDDDIIDIQIELHSRTEDA